MGTYVIRLSEKLDAELRRQREQSGIGGGTVGLHEFIRQYLEAVIRDRSIVLGRPTARDWQNFRTRPPKEQRGKWRATTPEQDARLRERMAELRESGLSWPEVAESLGLSPTTTLRRRRQFQIE